MADQQEPIDSPKSGDKQAAGNAEGGADSSGSGNILAGVQPDADDDEPENERREG